MGLWFSHHHPQNSPHKERRCPPPSRPTLTHQLNSMEAMKELNGRLSLSERMKMLSEKKKSRQEIKNCPPPSPPTPTHEPKFMEDMKELFEKKKPGQEIMKFLSSPPPATPTNYMEEEMKEIRSVMIRLGWIEEEEKDEEEIKTLTEMEEVVNSEKMLKDSEHYMEEDFKEVFETFDMNKDGVITPKEIQLLFNKIGHEHTLNDCTQMLSSIGGHKGLNLKKFKELISSDFRNGTSEFHGGWSDGECINY